MELNKDLAVGNYETWCFMQDLHNVIDCVAVVEKLNAIKKNKEVALMNMVYNSMADRVIDDFTGHALGKSIRSFILTMLGVIEWELVYTHLLYHVELKKLEKIRYDEIASYDNG